MDTNTFTLNSLLDVWEILTRQLIKKMKRNTLLFDSNPNHSNGMEAQLFISNQAFIVQGQKPDSGLYSGMCNPRMRNVKYYKRLTIAKYSMAGLKIQDIITNETCYLVNAISIYQGSQTRVSRAACCPRTVFLRPANVTIIFLNF